MGSRRTKPSEVFLEWRQLTLHADNKLPFEERHTRWRKLYEANYTDGHWLVPVDDADLISSMGAYLGFESKDYALTRRLSREFLEHPGLAAREPGNPRNRHWMGRELEREFAYDAVDATQHEALAALLEGDIDYGASLIRQAFPDARGWASSFRRIEEWLAEV